MDSITGSNVAIHQPTMNRVIEYNPSQGSVTETHPIQPQASGPSFTSGDIPGPVFNLPHQTLRVPQRLVPLRDDLSDSNSRSRRSSSVHACRGRGYLGHFLRRVIARLGVQRKESAHLQGQPHNTSLVDRVFGVYVWSKEACTCEPWDWVREHKYHRNWNCAQRRGFKRILRRMRTTSLGERRSINNIFNSKLGALGIHNIAVLQGERGSYKFYPLNEDKPKHEKWHFHEHERAQIDEYFPGAWEHGPSRLLKRGREALCAVYVSIRLYESAMSFSGSRFPIRPRVDDSGASSLSPDDPVPSIEQDDLVPLMQLDDSSMEEEEAASNIGSDEDSGSDPEEAHDDSSKEEDEEASEIGSEEAHGGTYYDGASDDISPGASTPRALQQQEEITAQTSLEEEPGAGSWELDERFGSREPEEVVWREVVW